MFHPFGFMSTQAGGGGGDADATAYLSAVTTAGGSTDATIDGAVDTLFTSLKSAGVYSKIYAFYPYIGGTAGSHIINANLNTSYDQVRSGGWTDNSSGALPNGINAWSDTQLLPSSALTKNNTALWTYLSGSGQSGYEADLGTGTYNTTDQFTALIRAETGGDQSSYFYAYDGGTSRISLNNLIFTDHQGLVGWNRPSANVFNVWLKGNKLATDTNATTGELNTTTNILVPAPGGNGLVYASRKHLFDAITEGFSDTEATDFQTAINTFQTTIGRNTY